MESTLQVPWCVFAPPMLDPCAEALFTVARVDLEWFNADRAAAELRAVCAERTPVDRVVVCLGQDRFVDLRGLRMLVDATEHARESGRTLVVLNAPSSLRRAVGVLGLESQIHLPRVVSLHGAAGFASDEDDGVDSIRLAPH